MARLTRCTRQNGSRQTEQIPPFIPTNSLPHFAQRKGTIASLVAMGGSSASCQDGLENLGVVAVVEAPRELVEVKREMVLRDLVERADDAALQERPERVKILRVDVAAHVLAVR